MKKPSLIQRLTGAYADYEEEDYEEDPRAVREHIRAVADAGAEPQRTVRVWDRPEDTEITAEEDMQEGELPIDMYETDDAIVINTLVAGVNPNDLDISITRDRVAIRGTRLMQEHISDNDFLNRELFWGSFSRSVGLPDEVMIDEAEAKERHGLLTIILPRLDKNRAAKLVIKAHK